MKISKRKKFLWAVLEDWTNTGYVQSSQLASFRKIAKVALFNPCMEFEFWGGKSLHLKWLRIVLGELYLGLRPSAYLSE